MAHYQNLPLFKAIYDLLIYLFTISRNFQKDYRYTIGENIKKRMLDMIVLLYKTNSSKTKSPLITQLREHLEAVRIEIRILFDLKQLSLKQYTKTSVELETISKQLSAWHKYELKKINNEINQ